MLSSQEINEYIAFITDALNDLTAGNGDLSRCVEIHERFRALRGQYRQQPKSLGSCVRQLSDLSRRFEGLLADRLAFVVDRFKEVNEQIRAGQQEKAFWREFLIRNATQTGRERLNGISAAVRVRSIPSRTLPPAGSGERNRLEDLIQECGCWAQVSQLSRPKLERALEGNLFATHQAEAIEHLCPPTVTYQVSSYALERSP